MDCSTYENCLIEHKTIIPEDIESDMLHLAFVGCWGVYCNNGKYRYIKKKKGQEEIVEVIRGQKTVARAIREYNKLHPVPISDMFLAGDNVYQEGVNEENKNIPIGVYNMKNQLRKGYKNCFAKTGVERFFVGIGNHDIEDCNILNTQKNYNGPRWNFPSLYYNVLYNVKTENGPFKVNVIVMDTNMFDVDDKELSPDEPQRCDKTPYSVGQLFSQKKWVRETIKQERADWTIIVGHIPYLANGHKKKNHPVYRIELANFIREVAPDLYICADEHNQQIIKDGKTTIIVCGSGGTSLDPIESPLIQDTVFAKSDFGFLALELTNRNLVVHFVSKEVVCKHVITKL